MLKPMLSAIPSDFRRRPNATEQACSDDFPDANAALLVVLFQHLIAGLAALGTILLKARQNGEIALVDHRPTITLNVPRTGCLLLRRAAALRLRLCAAAGGDRY